jgi:predicted short-subunit dehydrogenase-like oxidoreductase (DUF2520 family)
MGGCVARGNIGTVRAHFETLDALRPEAGDLYRTLARRTIRLAVERGTLGAEAGGAIANLRHPQIDR